MTRFQKFLALFATAMLACMFSSCASKTPEEVAERLKKKNEKYADYNEKKRLRIQARQERTDLWFKRMMGT